MLTKLRNARTDEGGFTLIELLVVILIIGILAAIALPSFLGQQKKGQDSSAKSDARNAVTQVESCFADTQDYSDPTCATALTASGLPVGTGAGKVSFAANGANGYTIVATSKSTNTFTITKTNGGPPTRSCTGSDGGCKASTW